MPLEHVAPVSVTRITDTERRVLAIPNLPPAKMQVFPISEPPPVFVIFPEWHKHPDLKK